MFITDRVAHCQYMASNDSGKRTGCLNYLFKYLIDEVFSKYRYFDFGIVNEKEGLYINKGMLFWKESFGGRSFTHDFYSIDTASYKLLSNYLEA